MTPAMEAVESEPQESQDLRALKATPLLALQAPRGHLGHQDEAMTGTQGILDHQGRRDLQDPPCLVHTGAHRRSVFLDHQDHLELLEYLDTPQG